MDAYGVCYHDATGEADVMCCQLVKSGIAWACLSDDMDMFVYGCARVLRHLSILNHTVIFYDTSSILNDIKLSEDNLRDILVLSGTDYNSRNETNLNETMKWYNEYKKGANSQMHFYDWLVKYTKYIKDINRLLTTRSMFVLENNDNVIFQEEDKCFNIDKLKTILIQDGFVFV
jgi:5'-3' exonuclease